MRIFSVILILIFGSCLATAQTELEQVAPNILAGQWTGHLDQESGGLAPKYTFAMRIQLEDGEIKGHSVIEVNGLKGKLSLKGTLNGTKVYLKEIKLTSKDIAAKEASWCIKTMNLELIFRDGKFRLEGKWKGFSNKFGSPCAPGKIYLSKKAIRA